MKMTKNWKRFWTLDRHHAEGFTLVELIVVIAILAILAGVAVPAYSGYIAEANKTADRQLIRDIEQALMMGYYQGLIADGASDKIVLTSTGIYLDGDQRPMAAEGNAMPSGADAALRATFGAEYKTQLVLKYDGWDEEVDGSLFGLTKDQAKAVYNSSYYKSADKLMGQVEEITKAAWQLVNAEGDTGAANREQMKEMFSDGNLDLDGLAEQYGYESWDDVPEAALPNMMVLAVATDVGDHTNDESGEYKMSKASGLITNFAMFNGYASTDAGKNANFDEKYDAFVKAINDPNADIGDVAAAYETLKAEAEKTGDAWANYKSSQSEKDVAAFSAMMSGLAGAAHTKSDGIKAGLTQTDFYTAGLGSELFANYMNSVEAMAGLSDGASEEILGEISQGNVVIFFTVNQGKISVGNTVATE